MTLSTWQVQRQKSKENKEKHVMLIIVNWSNLSFVLWTPLYWINYFILLYDKKKYHDWFIINTTLNDNKNLICNHLLGHRLEFDLHYEHELYKPFSPKNIIKNLYKLSKPPPPPISRRKNHIQWTSLNKKIH
jgi:hypothetical protein